MPERKELYYMTIRSVVEKFKTTDGEITFVDIEVLIKALEDEVEKHKCHVRGKRHTLRRVIDYDNFIGTQKKE